MSEGWFFLSVRCASVARIWSNAWLRKQMNVRVLKKEFLPLLHIFDRHNERPQDSVSWYAMGGTRKEFYKLLVNAVELHGSKAIESLRVEFESVWNNPETSIFWPTIHAVRSYWHYIELDKIGSGQSRVLHH